MCTPCSRAFCSASPNSGCVLVFGVKYLTFFIWTTKKIYASYPSRTALHSSSTCFTPRSVGASGNFTTPSSSSVTPFTSIKILRSPSSAYRSNLEFPYVTSCLSIVGFSQRFPASIHSFTALFGICESILIRRFPFFTLIRSHFVFRSGLSLLCT